MSNDKKPEERDPTEEGSSESEDEGRREFMKKLPYVAPVIQTFLFSDGVLASGKQRGNQKSQRRTQKGVSPNPGKGKPPPPPPANDG